MELTNYIIDTAMSMKQVQFQQSVGVSLMKKSMEMSQESMDAALQMMDAAPARAFPGDVGAIFDVRA